MEVSERQDAAARGGAPWGIRTDARFGSRTRYVWPDPLPSCSMRPLLLLALALSVQSAPAAAGVSTAIAPPAAAHDSTAGQPIEVGGALPFRTRLPDGVTFAQTASDEGERTAFQIGGYDALVLFVPAPGAGFDDLRALASRIAGDSSLVASASPAGPFRWQVNGRRYVLSAGERNGRQYLIIKNVSVVDTWYEADRARTVQLAWAWLPDGEPLR